MHDKSGRASGICGIVVIMPPSFKVALFKRMGEILERKDAGLGYNSFHVFGLSCNVFMYLSFMNNKGF